MIAIFPELIQSVKSKDLERLALLTRKYYAGAKPFHPQVDMHSLLEAVGFLVEKRPLENDSILCVEDQKGRFRAVAFMNQKITDPAEMNFLMAHVLGHFLLHVQPKIATGQWETSGMRELISPLRRYISQAEAGSHRSKAVPMELEADEFASILLMPKVMIMKAAMKFSAIERLAAFFAVNPAAMEQRLNTLGMLERAPVNFHDAESMLTNKDVSSHQAPEAPLHSEQGMGEPKFFSKAFAAANYMQQDKLTASAVSRKDPVAAPAKLAMQEADARKKANEGLSRLRELAKRIDKSVE